LLSFNVSIRQSAASFHKNLGLDPNTIVVGFHIRRGDYRTYESGKYFLSDQEWLTILSQVRNQVSDSGYLFHGLLFSNEDVSSLVDSGNDLSLGPGSSFLDIASMMLCDFLVGPPSTFSGWASFYASVPLTYVDSSSLSFDIFKSIPVAW
jgi:hypothetical protein